MLAAREGRNVLKRKKGRTAYVQLTLREDTLERKSCDGKELVHFQVSDG